MVASSNPFRLKRLAHEMDCRDCFVLSVVAERKAIGATGAVDDRGEAAEAVGMRCLWTRELDAAVRCDVFVHGFCCACQCLFPLNRRCLLSRTLPLERFIAVSFPSMYPVASIL